MSEHLYEVGFQVTSAGAAGALCEIIPAALAAGKRPPEVRELGVWVVTPPASGAPEVGLGQPAAIGVTPGGTQTVQATDTFDTIAGNTTVATSWGTAPTAPSAFRRRWPLQALAGAGTIMTWNPGEWVFWQGAAVSTIVLRQLSAVATTYDIYVKVAE